MSTRPPTPSPSRRSLLRALAALPASAVLLGEVPALSGTALAAAPTSGSATRHTIVPKGRHVHRPHRQRGGFHPLRVVQPPRLLPAPLRLPTPGRSHERYRPLPAGQLVRAGDGLGLSRILADGEAAYRVLPEALRAAPVSCGEGARSGVRPALIRGREGPPRPTCGCRAAARTAPPRPDGRRRRRAGVRAPRRTPGRAESPGW